MKEYNRKEYPIGLFENLTKTILEKSNFKFLYDLFFLVIDAENPENRYLSYSIINKNNIWNDLENSRLVFFISLDRAEFEEPNFPNYAKFTKDIKERFLYLINNIEIQSSIKDQYNFICNLEYPNDNTKEIVFPDYTLLPVE